MIFFYLPDISREKQLNTSIELPLVVVAKLGIYICIVPNFSSCRILQYAFMSTCVSPATSYYPIHIFPHLDSLKNKIAVYVFL